MSNINNNNNGNNKIRIVKKINIINYNKKKIKIIGISYDKKLIFLLVTNFYYNNNLKYIK